MGELRKQAVSELLKVQLTVRTQDGLVVTVDFNNASDFGDALRWINELTEEEPTWSR